jgi:transposase-like protein
MRCKRDYTNAPKPSYRADTVRMALVLYYNLGSYRRVGRLLGVNHQTIINWHVKWGTLISSLLDTKNPPEISFTQRVERVLAEGIKQQLLEKKRR